MSASANVLATPDRERHPCVTAGGPVALTVAFTDLEDFTAYTRTAGDDAARRLLADHHGTAGPIVRSRGGRILKRLGDGFMLIFPAPEAAVLACLELADASPLRLRAGVHAGTVLVTGDDVVGQVVNLAARVAASARGDQLLVTGAVRDAIAGVPGIAFHDPRPVSFKGIGDPVEVCAVVRAGGRARLCDLDDGSPLH